ncbi:MAG: ATPase [Clostridium sp.]|nr:ATPase [Clostridium sp.]
MPEERVRRMFLGGNTFQGFFSHYDYILGQKEASKIICIKGGPGTGKSTFMRKIGLKMLDLGYNVEFMHCSSDSSSLDGIVIPKIKVALVDGTYPHIVDPKNPGAVDEIINLGDFWDEKGIRKNKTEILKINKKTKKAFESAYRYIKAAHIIYQDNEDIIKNFCCNRGKINRIAAEVEREMFFGQNIATHEGGVRRLFAGAITPEGYVNHLDTLIRTDKVYAFNGVPEIQIQHMLEGFKTRAVQRGFDVEAFYCALNPNKLEHLIIPGLGTSFTTSNEFHSRKAEGTQDININDCLDTGDYLGIIERNRISYRQLLATAIDHLSLAKGLHESLESLYIPYMDFNAVQECYESTLKKISRISSKD